MIENEEKGTYEPRKLIEEKLRESEGERMREKFKLL